MLLLCYPRCSTCRKAQAFLDEHGISYDYRHIAEENPTAEEIKTLKERSGLPLKKFFNTSGLVYKDLQLSSKLGAMTEEEQYALLASNGMLVKRPLLVSDTFVLVGFKEEEWRKTLL